MSRITLFQFVNASAVSFWLLVVGIPALIAMTLAIGVWITRHRKPGNALNQHAGSEHIHLDGRAAEEQQPTAASEEHASTLSLLYQELLQFEQTLCGTDEQIEREKRLFCQKAGIPDQRQEPLEGTMELSREVITLQKVVLAAHCILGVRFPDLDTGLSQSWSADSHDRLASWSEQRQSLTLMKRLLPRVQELEQTLRVVHGVCPGVHARSYPVFPVRNYQDLYEVAVALHGWLELRLHVPKKTTNLEAMSITQSVEYLEKRHWQLDGSIDLFHEDTAVWTKHMVAGAWDSVMAYVFDSRPDFVLDYYLESQRQQKEEYAKAEMILILVGKCGQRASLLHLTRSLKHWAYWQALSLVLHDERDPDHVGQAYDQFLRDIEWKIPHSLLGLQQAMEAFSLETNAGQEKSFS